MEKKSLEETVDQLSKIKKDQKKQKQKMSDDVKQKIIKKVFKNLLAAILLMVYFAILNISYTEMIQERLMFDIKVFAIIFLLSGIVMFEKAYKKDSGKEVVRGIELLVIAFHSLSIMHVITLYEYNFMLYLLTSSYIFSIYYVLKCIIIYFRERKNYIKSLSDISEIIKREEPQIKEATKKNLEENIEENKIKKESQKKNTKKLEKKTTTTTKKKNIKTSNTTKETKNTNTKLTTKTTKTSTKTTKNKPEVEKEQKEKTKKTNNKKKKEENIND